MRVKPPFAVAVSVLLTGSVRQTFGPPAHLPAHWIAVASPDPQADGAICAYWSDTTWDVSLTPDSTALQIARHPGEPDIQTIDVSGGRLLGYNAGEFGGEVVFVGHDDRVTSIAKQNLSFFVPSRFGVLGLGGTDHLGLNEGWLLLFKPRSNAAWAAETLMSIKGEPRAYTALGDDTLLVVTMGTLVLLRPPSSKTVLYRTPLMSFIDPHTVVRDRAGVIYLGTRYAVTRLTPGENGYADDWIVPASCPRRVRTAETGKCACADVQRR